MFASTQSTSFGYLPAHLADPGGEIALRFLAVSAVIDPPELLQAVVVRLAGGDRHQLGGTASGAGTATNTGKILSVFWSLKWLD